MQLRDYQLSIIDEARDLMRAGERSILICAPTGCISGDAMVRLNRCKKGYSRSLEKEYLLQDGYSKSFPTMIRGLRNDKSGVGLIRLRGGVSYSGKLNCIEIATKNRSLKLTPEHLVWTKSGWVRADQTLGVEIAVDTPRASSVVGVKSKKASDSFVSSLPFHPHASTINSVRDGSYKKIEIHRAIYEAHINGLSLDQYKVILRTNPEVARTLIFMNPKTHEIHHINGDHYDNSCGNLASVTIEEHQKIHALEHRKNFHQGEFKWEVVTSLKSVGLLDTYDAIDSETSSFTANDIVVHNSGKTALTAHMLARAAEKKQRSYFIVHRRELVKQSMMAFDKVGIRHGVIANGFIEDRVPAIQVASIGTLKTRHQKMPAPNLIVWDECHHLGAKSWEEIFKAYPNSFHIGLTATPQRLDGKGLDEYFTAMVKGPSVRSLIDQGYLSDYKLYAPSTPNLTGLHSRMGDFIKSELIAVMDKPTITGSAIGEYKRRALGKRAVVFAISIEHSQHIVSEFNRQGITAEHVDGDCPIDQRDAALKRFASGETLIISSVDIFSEGFDLPSVECAILLRPTQSLGLYLQQVGRALRPSPGKSHAIILDHAANAGIHGLPDDDREWSLFGIERRKRKKDTEQSIKVCPSCFAAQLPGSTTCKYCGNILPSKPRVVDEVEGQLTEVDTSSLRQTRKIEQSSARNREELLAIATKRGYANPRAWAHFVMQGRQRKKLRGG